MCYFLLYRHLQDHGHEMRAPRPAILLLLLVPGTSALYDICYFRKDVETCSIGEFDPPLLHTPPPTPVQLSLVRTQITVSFVPTARS